VRIETKVFELFNGRYRSLSELAKVMEISVSQVYRVYQGKRHINEKFIIGAINAFPQHKLDELFYLAPESASEAQPEQKVQPENTASFDRVITEELISPDRRL